MRKKVIKFVTTVKGDMFTWYTAPNSCMGCMCCCPSDDVPRPAMLPLRHCGHRPESLPLRWAILLPESQPGISDLPFVNRLTKADAALLPLVHSFSTLRSVVRQGAPDPPLAPVALQLEATCDHDASLRIAFASKNPPMIPTSPYSRRPRSLQCRRFFIIPRSSCTTGPVHNPKTCRTHSLCRCNVTLLNSLSLPAAPPAHIHAVSAHPQRRRYAISLSHRPCVM